MSKKIERQDITINANPAVTVLYARFIQMNLEELIEFGKETLKITDVTAEEFEHITNELMQKSMDLVVNS